MQTEPDPLTSATVQPKPAPVLRRPVVALSAAFVAGWLMCLGVVNWRQRGESTSLSSVKHAPSVSPAPALLAAQESNSTRTLESMASPPPATTPVAAPVAAATPVEDKQKPDVTQSVAPAPARTDPIVASESIPSKQRERERERDAVVQLFKKNQDNLR